MSLLTLLLLQTGCASERWTYIAPPGIDQKTLAADQEACEEESGIVRLGEEQKLLAQQCMMTRGYTMRKTP